MGRQIVSAMAWKAVAKVQSLTHTIDANGQVLGRLATRISGLLMGKHKPIFDPAKDCSDKVVVTNVRELQLTGNKMKQKLYRYHTGYPGGLREKTAKDLMED